MSMINGIVVEDAEPYKKGMSAGQEVDKRNYTRLLALQQLARESGYQDKNPHGQISTEQVLFILGVVARFRDDRLKASGNWLDLATMSDPFQLAIYQQDDPENRERAVWVRIRPGESSIFLEVFREQPDADTGIQHAMASLEFAPCYENQCKMLLWKEHENPDKDDGRELVLIEDIQALMAAQEGGS